ncbi:MAG: Methionyl-tRNA formyltransferase [Parcubacteria group bacterium GW2011_GWC1_34_10]|nr:MAG: Methionyl-tRNA formyltransferase [Parcubacteria group bacterium GW2011_GWC1_34_10]
MKFIFFGTSEFSVYVLEELKTHNILPRLIVSSPDKPKGRKLIITPTPAKIWAEKNNIPVYQPKSLRSLKKDGTPFEEPAKNYLENFLNGDEWDLFLVASYGKIIPREIFDIPVHKTLNIHPSLLPKYRGASPIQAQILNDEKNIGVTIMQIDEGMDTGPIIIQKRTSPPATPSDNSNMLTAPLSLIRRGGMGGEVIILGQKELQKKLAIEGARLFAHILPEWLIGAIDPIMQNESLATECGKIEKADGEIDLKDDPYKNFLKIKAFENWPGTYFYTERGNKKIRVIITDAKLKDNNLEILKIIPEGKKEMSYESFMQGQK